MNEFTKNIDLNAVLDNVYYDETSPSCLRWKVSRPGCALHGVAGTKRKDGYWSVQINKERFLAHRIVWLLFNYKIDSKLVIDHIDRNPSNNFIDNLRLVTQAENNQNKGDYRKV